MRLAEKEFPGRVQLAGNGVLTERCKESIMRNKRYGWKSVVLLVMVVFWLCGVNALAEGASGDNSLSTLGITTEGATVSPEFYYSTIEYNVTVPGGTTELSLDPVPSNSGARIVEITGTTIENGKATVEIKVEAENGNPCSYFLYVTADESSQAPAAAETEPETEKQTEKQTETEPETEDPRYVKVDRSLVEEAENTITALKAETSSYRDRANLLLKILYGMIGFCVILLFVVINLILKKKDLKAELQEYMGYGYPGDRADLEEGTKYRAGAEDYEPGYPEESYQSSYEEPYQNPAPYEEPPYEEPAYEDRSGQRDYESGYGDEAEFVGDLEQEKTGRKAKKSDRKMKDDPETVPKPSKARKKSKPMPEYDPPRPEYHYQPPKEKSSDNVEINMIDL